MPCLSGLLPTRSQASTDNEKARECGGEIGLRQSIGRAELQCPFHVQKSTTSRISMRWMPCDVLLHSESCAERCFTSSSAQPPEACVPHPPSFVVKQAVPAAGSIHGEVRSIHAATRSIDADGHSVPAAARSAAGISIRDCVKSPDSGGTQPGWLCSSCADGYLHSLSGRGMYVALVSPEYAGR